jgi:predicted transcriptional regulator
VLERGELAKRVLETLRDGDELSVREVVDRLGSGHAYTTILTVLDRLHDKGEVRRRKAEGAWCYRATVSREEAAAAQLASLLESSRGSDAFLMAFVDRAESVDASILDRLEKLIRSRRGARR